MKKTLVAGALIGCAFVFGASEFSTVSSFTAGAPTDGQNGYTGSPADGQTCARSGCHNSNVTDMPGWITSDIDSTGYVGGETYTISAKVVDMGRSKFGFMLSPQDAQGNALGTMIASSETQLKTSGKFITHLSSSTAGTDSVTWTFDWTAPASGTGEVTFYAAFNGANGDNTPGSDNIFTSSLTVNENPAVGVADILRDAAAELRVYPNPATDVLNVALTEQDQNIQLELFNTAGQRVLVKQQTGGASTVNMALPTDLPRGLYLLKASDRDGATRVILQ